MTFPYQLKPFSDLHLAGTVNTVFPRNNAPGAMSNFQKELQRENLQMIEKWLKSWLFCLKRPSKCSILLS